MRFTMTTQVVILGYGEIGKAIHHLLLPQTDITVTCWDKNSDIIPEQHPLQSIIPTCDVLFICVPTWTVRSALQGIHPFLNPKTIVVSPSKGFEKETCQRVDTLFPQNLPKHNPFVFLGGPMIAEEIMADLSAVGVVASESSDARNAVSALFASTRLITCQTDDVIGTVLASALKNIYAIGLGICSGLKMGSNVHGALVSQATREMMHVLKAIGGQPETAFGPAGIGDLVATSQSALSTNFTTGIRFAQGLQPVRGSEGLNTIPCIANIQGLILADLPLLRAIYRTVEERKPAHEELLQAVLAFCPIPA